MGISNVAYFHGTVEEAYLEKIKLGLENEKVAYCSLSQMCSIEMDNFSHIMVTGNVKEIKEVLELALRYDKTVGIIAMPQQKELMKTFALSSNLEVNIAQALVQSEEKIDVLYANNEMVLQEVVIGDVPPLDQFDSSLKGKTFFTRIGLFFHTLKKVKSLHHSKIKVTDAKENEIKFSAVGLVGLEYNNDTFAAKLIANEINATDGKLSLVILSPISIIQYMSYLFKSLVSQWTPDKLPSSMGFVRSSTFKIESNRPLDVVIDTASKAQTPLYLRVEEKALALSVGEGFWEKQSQENNGKDSIKIDHLPKDEESAGYLSKAIPLFSHASQEQYASLFANLREESKINTSFVVLLVLATVIATFGLFINSSSVIIGAMLLAPLMQPIVSLSMGVLRQDSVLEIRAAKSIFLGVFFVLLTAASISWMIPIEKLTSEMSGRLSPTILDLFVAIASGAAAAYAKSNEKVLGSLAGVAIAVALVPPVAVAGIGIGWGSWHIFSLAFLLFMTNLVGIVFAAAFTFVILGFSPIGIAKKGIITWLTIMMFVAIPLYSSFEHMKQNIFIQKTLGNLELTLDEHKVKLTHIVPLKHREVLKIHCEVISNGLLTPEETKKLHQVIEDKVGEEVDVLAIFRYRL
jgi:uncharacterized hydrophobic protein (TIGR00271 family)